MKIGTKKKFRHYFLCIILFILGIFLYLFFFSEEVFGTWGINKTVGWAWDMTNFTWWLAILKPIIGLILIVKVLIKVKNHFKA